MSVAAGEASAPAAGPACRGDILDPCVDSRAAPARVQTQNARNTQHAVVTCDPCVQHAVATFAPCVDSRAVPARLQTQNARAASAPPRVWTPAAVAPLILGAASDFWLPSRLESSTRRATVGRSAPRTPRLRATGRPCRPRGRPCIYLRPPRVRRTGPRSPTRMGRTPRSTLPAAPLGQNSCPSLTVSTAGSPDRGTRAQARAPLAARAAQNFVRMSLRHLRG